MSELLVENIPSSNIIWNPSWNPQFGGLDFKVDDTLIFRLETKNRIAKITSSRSWNIYYGRFLHTSSVRLLPLTSTSVLKLES